MIGKIATCVMVSISLCAFAQRGTAAESKGESENAFMEMHRVLIHPRCLNCHPKPEFNRIVHAWAKAGAVCPK